MPTDTIVRPQVVAGGHYATTDVEILHRPPGQSFWDYHSTVAVATSNLTEWLRTWLRQNNIRSGEWVAGDKWGGIDSAVLRAELLVA